MNFTLDLKRLFVYQPMPKGETENGVYKLAFYVVKQYNSFMNELFTQKYDNEEWVEDEYPWKQYRRKGYGFIYIKNPDFPMDDDREYLIRKPTPQERREIIIKTVIKCNGRTFKVHALAVRLAVSDRTVQTVLRQLEKDKLIQITPSFKTDGKQKGNAYKYIGPPCEFYGSGLTLKDLYDIGNGVGFRDWAWKTHGFGHDQNWHNIYPLCKAKFERRTARWEYLEANGLPLKQRLSLFPRQNGKACVGAV